MTSTAEFLANSHLSTDAQREVERERVEYFKNGVGSSSDKLNSLSRFISRQNMAKYLAYYETFRATQGVLGSIVECGVYFGNAMMAYAHYAAALEPYNYQSRIIGFDTFEGDAGVTDRDLKNPHFTRTEKDYYADSQADLLKAIEIYDRDRPLNHLRKIELVKGDLRQTAPQYVTENPALTIRILQLSVNLYEPTKAALEAFMPRIARGGIVAIHGINYSAEGACQALIETVGPLKTIPIKAHPFYPNFCYFVVD